VTAWFASTHTDLANGAQMCRSASPSDARPGSIAWVQSDEWFSRAKSEIMSSGPPSDGDNLLGMQMDFDVYWDRSPLLRDVVVTRTESTDHLLAVTARSVPGVNDVQLKHELVRIWADASYTYRTACATQSDDEEVRMEAVTQIEPSGLFVTSSVTVRRA
jgi:hypothetical protein